jgi:hypothetical protein
MEARHVGLDFYDLLIEVKSGILQQLSDQQALSIPKGDRVAFAIRVGDRRIKNLDATNEGCSLWIRRTDRDCLSSL